jgi:hypothetical protein
MQIFATKKVFSAQIANRRQDMGLENLLPLYSLQIILRQYLRNEVLKKNMRCYTDA